MSKHRQSHSQKLTHASTCIVAFAAALGACSTDPSPSTALGGTSATGGTSPATGGVTSSTGGMTASTGGSTTGGTAPSTGGTIATTGGAEGSTTGGSSGGTSSGGGSSGSHTAGTSSGGTSSGGTSSDGTSSGGASSGGGSANTGGNASGTGGTAGSSGAGGKSAGGTPGTGGSGSAGTLCPPNAIICEDFEDGDFDGWTTNLSGGTLVVNGTKPSHGKNSLQIDVAAMQYGGALIRKGAPLFPLPNKRMWGRLMIYFDTIADGHTDFIRGAATNGATPQYNVAEQHGEIMLNYYAGSASDCWARPKPGKVVPLKTWMCWEWSFDGATNQMQFYIDGTLSRQVDAVGDGCLTNPTQTWVAPVFSELRIGEYIAERSPNAQRIWIDDIAVGTTSRIACPAP